MANWGTVGEFGGGLNIFFRGRNVHQGAIRSIVPQCSATPATVAATPPCSATPFQRQLDMRYCCYT